MIRQQLKFTPDYDEEIINTHNLLGSDVFI